MIAVLIADQTLTKAKWYSTTLWGEAKLEKKIKEKADEEKIKSKLAIEFGVKPADIFKFWVMEHPDD